MLPLTLTAAGAGAGFAVVSGVINLPRVGAWTADLEVANAAAMSGKVDLALSSSLTLRGSIARAGVLDGVLRARVVAGGNGLRSSVTPKHYTGPSARVVLSDILADVGEVLSATADRNILNTQLEHWTTIRMPAARAIRCLLERVGEDIAWRLLPDGTFWVGRETWPTSSVTDATEVDGSTPETKVVELTVVSPVLLPGTSAPGGWPIDHVEYRVGGGKVRGTAWLAAESGGAGSSGSNLTVMPSLDRPKGSMAALSGVCPTLDYQRLYRGKVLKQHPNLRRVDLQPADPRLPPMSNIPLRVGVPGLDVTITAGHLLAVGFEDGQPDRPLAAPTWEPGTQGTTPVKATFNASVMELGGPVTPVQDGVVTGQGKDPYTGLPYWMLGNSSTVVGAKR